jgi:NADH:ubiquinone reductase (H+-translocating)
LVTSIVIVGSGFTGFTCAHRLARILGRQHAPVDITITSPVDYMLYTPLLPDVAGGLVDARFVTVPLANTLKGVKAVRGRVDAVDFAQQTLTYCDPEERSHSLSWDRLVLTPGSVTRLFDVPGLATHARGLKTTASSNSSWPTSRTIQRWLRPVALSSWSARPIRVPSWSFSCGP